MKSKLVVIILLCASIAYATTSNRILKSITTRDGLSNNTAFSIIQDSEGLIWIGSGEGLNQYNGYDFTYYFHNAQDSNSISNEEIFSICEDLESNIWIATREGLNKYNRSLNQIERIIDNKAKKVLNSIETSVVFCDKKGNIWAGTIGSGLLFIEHGNKPYKRYNISNDASINDFSRIKAIFEDSKGNMWIGTRKQGLFKINVTSGEIVNFRHNPKNSFSISGNHIRSISEDQDKNIWIGTEENGINLLKNSSIEFYNAHNFDEFRNLKNEKVRCLLCKGEDEMWLGTRNGIFIFGVSNDTIQFSHKYLPNNSIRSLCEDYHGKVWIGTYYEGIKTDHDSHNYFYNITTENGLGKNNFFAVSAIMSYQDQFWLGTQRDGVYILNKKKELVKKLFDADEKLHINTLAGDNSGNIWIGTLDNGLIRHNLTKNTNKYYKHIEGNATTIAHNTIYSIYNDSKNRLWVGTNTGGLNLYDKENDKFISINKNNGFVDLLGVNIYSITETDKGILCVGTNLGVNLYDVENNSNQSINNKNNKILSQSIISTLFYDSNTLWIGTSGGGLNELNLSTNEVTIYNSENGLTSEMIKGISKDKNNKLWVSTNNGLFLYDETTSTFLKFDIEDGVVIESFDNSSTCMDDDGTIYFGGVNGVAYFHPEDIKLNKKHSPIIISKIKEFDSPLNTKYISKKEQDLYLDLPHDIRALTFEFAALNYLSPSKNSYAYKLDNYFDEWIEMGNKRSITFTALPTGEYQLHLKAANNHGTWTESKTIVNIRVNPPLWQKWYAYIIYAILLFIVLFLFHRYTISWASIKHQLEVEKQDAESIKQVNQLKLRFFTNISHEFRTPLTLIINAIQDLKTKGTEAETDRKTIKTLENNSNRLLKLITELMDFRKAESGVLELDLVKGDISEFTQVILSDFQQYADNKNIELVFTTLEEKFDAWFDPSKMEKVLVNLISNALNHSINKVNVSISINNDDCIITVMDDGKGIPIDEQDKVFDRFFQGADKSSSGTGVGLALTKQLISLHSGSIEVESVPHQTSFVVSLPLLQHKTNDSEMKSFDLGEWKSKEYNFIPIDNTRPLESDQDKSTKDNIMLIVEDNIELSDYLREQYTDRFRILQSANGKLGLSEALQHIPDIIVSDIMMPEMDGIEMCNKLKNDQLTSHIPIILLTAKGTDESKVEGLQSGADAYIQKPFNQMVLQAQVDNLMNSRKLLREKFAGMNFVHSNSLYNNKHDSNFLDKAIASVENHIDNPEYEVTNLCKDLNMSRSVLYRKIKALTDLAPQEFIKNLRLRKATTLLKNDELSINEIASEVGFINAKHFSTSFKKLYHSTPSEYRNIQDED